MNSKNPCGLYDLVKPNESEELCNSKNPSGFCDFKKLSVCFMRKCIMKKKEKKIKKKTMHEKIKKGGMISIF